MNESRNYTDERPEVPELVHQRVLNTLKDLPKEEKNASAKEVRTEPVRFKRRKAGRVAALALAAALVLSIGAFAADRFGLVHFLGRSDSDGMENTQLVSQLSQSMEGPVFSNDYATYAVREALTDGSRVYLTLEVRPADPERSFLLPESLMLSPDSSADPLTAYEGLEDAAGKTVKEFAAEKGKEVVLVGASLQKGEQLLSVTQDVQIDPDGTVTLLLAGDNADLVQSTDLTVTGTAYKVSDSVASRAGTDVTLTNTSETVTLPCTLDTAKVQTETGITLSGLQLRETKLGLYADFTVEGALPENVSLDLVLSDGTVLKNLPYIAGSGLAEDGNGTSFTKAYQLPEDLSELCLKVTDTDSGASFVYPVDIA